MLQILHVCILPFTGINLWLSESNTFCNTAIVAFIFHEVKFQLVLYLGNNISVMFRQWPQTCGTSTWPMTIWMLQILLKINIWKFMTEINIPLITRFYPIWPSMWHLLPSRELSYVASVWKLRQALLGVSINLINIRGNWF